MSSYKKYISMGLSIILIPLAKMVLTKMMDNNSKKFDEETTTKDRERA
ncbi:MAG: hypothetical protein HQK76_12495 [Desulfobacterales bacterium]|nr:hypothetical protein [Desulfobacterales bacterium]